MKFLKLLPAFLGAVLTGTVVAQSTLYVAPTGTDGNPGTLASPTTLQRAITSIAAGGTIFMRGGTYNYSAGVTIAVGNNGSKRIEAYQGEVPVLNFSGQATADLNRGFTVNGNNWYIKGLVVERAGDNGIFVGGSNNTFELCTTRFNSDSGLQLSRYASTAPRSAWPSNNLMLNCTSHDNKDPDSEDADGFACKLTSGDGNVFRGCISHHNIDDGWDFYAKDETGPIGVVTLENCVAYSNGALSDGSTSGNGDKNGFKLGGSGIRVDHIVRRCVAFNNGKHGFTDNNNLGSIKVTNNTSFNNAETNFQFREGGSHVFTNNLSFQGKSSDKTTGTDVASSNVFWKNNASSNGKGLVVSAADFVSVSVPGSVGRDGTNAPNLGNFLALASGSDLINAGVTATGITFTGSAPDIGARESGSTTPPPPGTYTLTTTASPSAGGSITRSPNAASYNSGTVVNLTATPASGYTFTGWSGAVTSTAATVSVTVTANRTVTANFQTSGTPGSNTVRIEDAASFGNGYCAADGSRQNTNAGADNGFYINLSNSVGKGISYSVNTPAAGTYTLRFRYANGGSSSATTAKVLVNGATAVASVSFPRTASSSTWTTTTTTVSLRAGVNAVRLETTVSSEFANIDWLEVTGNGPTAAACSGSARVAAVTAAAAPSCAVVGWATQNGGTTGGGNATPTVVSNYTDFKNAVTSATVKVVHISGTITFPAAGRINFQDQSGKTIYGLPGSKLISSDRTASGSGILYVKRSSNIIFRNITFEGPGAFDTDGNDHMTIDNCTNVWVDHCDFQDGVDGNLDVKNAADYISITWCRFVYLKPPIAGGSGGADDHRFSNLFGSSDGATADRGKLRITMQNNWWAQGCKERMPRVRFGKVHLVNNYFSSAGNNHCIRAGFEADLLVESNYFDGVNLPIDLFENDFTAVTSRNNVYIATSGNTAGRGTAFTPPYALDIAPANDVKALLTNSSCGAGATMSSPTNCCGSTPPPTTYALTTTSAPSAGGSVSRSPNAASYAAGTVVTLTATPASGYTFAGWSGAVTSSAATISVTMDANKTVTANFQTNTGGPTTYVLTTTASPSAGGSITRNPNAASYNSGTVVNLTATPASGYTFTGWTGAVTSTATTVSVTMTANRTVTANFQTSSTPGGNTVRIEDAASFGNGYCAADGSRQNTNAGADNGFYVNLSNSVGKGITYSLNAPAAGTYTLRFRYANGGSSSATTAKVLVNGATAVASVSFPKTASSSTWTTTTTTVSLRAGVNAVRLETTVSSEFANIDWLEVTGNSPTAAACSGSARVAAPEFEVNAPRIFPNPSAGRTTIGFTLATKDRVSVQVHSVTGHLLSTVTNEMYEAGYHEVGYEHPSLKSGVYLINIHTTGKKQTLKLLVK